MLFASLFSFITPVDKRRTGHVLGVVYRNVRVAESCLKKINANSLLSANLDKRFPLKVLGAVYRDVREAASFAKIGPGVHHALSVISCVLV